MPLPLQLLFLFKELQQSEGTPFSLLTRALKSNPNLSEIYILSPTFDASPDFKKRLNILREMKHNTNLHTELRASRISPETAQLLSDAGFKSLEVGLQTLTPHSLETVRRNSNPERELEGICHLRDAGIDLKIGIIPGLPGDTPDSFRYTVDRLLDLNLGDSIELYPLMILPGTAIREQAERDKVSFMKEPPYFYLDGWGMSTQDIKDISLYLEEATGLSQSSFSIPDFSFSDTEKEALTAACILNDDSGQYWESSEIIDCIETSLFSYHFTTPLNARLYGILKKLLIKLPPKTSLILSSMSPLR